MIILIDNYDSFTYNLVHYFQEIGEEVVVFRNDEKVKAPRMEFYIVEILADLVALYVTLFRARKLKCEQKTKSVVLVCKISSIPCVPVMSACLGSCAAFMFSYS